jgi:hypothetical protein
MESRAYGAVPKPSSLFEYRSSTKDRVVALVSAGLFAVAAYAIYFVLPVSFP